MKAKRKDILILFLLVVIVILIVMMLFLNNSGSDNGNSDQNYQEQISELTEQLQYQNLTTDDEIEIENVCTNFLKTYYSIENSKSQNSSAEQCKKYITDELYKQILPSEAETEYSSDEIDVDYSSNIIIRDTFTNNSIPEEFLVNCTINKNVNGMKSSNEYYVVFSMVQSNNEWLISDFELVSVQGG